MSVRRRVSSKCLGMAKLWNRFNKLFDLRLRRTDRRRTRLALKAAYVCLSVIAVCAPANRRASAATDATAKPNVLIIYTDDQGFGDAGCLNPNAKFETPNLDRIARDGISFTDAHCSDTVCTPSRYGLLTGRYCWRTVKKTGVLGAEAPCLIDDDRLTIASLLGNQGYATAMVGKWHLGMDFPGTSPQNRDWSRPVLDMPLDKGFDYFFGIPASLNYGVLAWFQGRHAAVPPTLFTAKKPNQRHVDYRIMPPYQSSREETAKVLGKSGMEVADDFVDNQCLTRFTDEAIAWMQRHVQRPGSQPFFLYLPLTSPHYPVCPLPEFHGRGKAGGYGEFMVETDYHIGRILEFLDRAQLDANTLVIVTSDNGPENSWRERQREFSHSSNGPYREGKRSIYEGGHRVPFLLRWPERVVLPGRSCGQTICQTDIMATLAELLDVELPENAGEDSQSFFACLTDPECTLDRAPIVHHAAKGQFAVRSGPWKLVLPHKKQHSELYDLATDPGEKTNVIQRFPQEALRLEKQITQIVVRGRTTAGVPQPNDTGYWPDLTWISPEQYQTQSASAGSTQP